MMIVKVSDEAAKAHERYGHFHSSHEGFGVLDEEVAELRDAIRANDIDAIRREAIQVSAVALRIAMATECADFIKRSTK